MEPMLGADGSTGFRREQLSIRLLALLLVVPIIVGASGLMAIIIAPPFVGAAYAVQELDRRLQAAGADFNKIPDFPERSIIYANDGRTVLATVYLDNREIVKLSKVSPIAKQAVLAIEDSGFYQHGPLNWASLMRAVIENVKAGDIVQGGSTITQQLVKNTLGLDPYDRSFERKFQELALAIRVEDKYSKDEIFELYLNELYLGNGVYGFGTAADFYFHKKAADLTLTEGAMIAGMARAPEYWDPLDHPHKALVRRNDVLNRMYSLGWISEEENETAKAKGLGLAKGAGKLRLSRPPFFVTYLQDWIIADPHKEFRRLGKTERARRRTLFEGGLKIVTTLDAKWQQQAEQAANAPWAISPANPGYKQKPEVAIVSLDTDSGAIRTMLSGKNYKRDAKDFVTTGHQPGSSYKPFILAAAFEAGIPPTQTYSTQSPMTFPNYRDEITGEPWTVFNAEGAGNQGFVDLYRATASSINVVFAQLILDVGPTEVDDVTERLTSRDRRPTRDIPGFASQATGSVEMSPLEMAAGFQTIANDGRRCSPYPIESMVADGQLLYKHKDPCTQELDSAIARTITGMLVGVVRGGTATGAFSGWGPWPVAGKTGTAQLNTNVWFVGYTRQVTTSVWVGFPGNTEPLQNYFGTDVFGGTIAAPIWRAYMSRVMSGMPAQSFSSPPAPERGRVPGVIGLAENRAVVRISAAGFQVDVKQVDSLKPKGVVVSQAPGGGASAVLGTIVRLQVSTGKPPKVVVPRVRDMPYPKARAILRDLGLAVVKVPMEVVQADKVGIVLAQDPVSGTEVKEGATVTLTVGVEAPPPITGTPGRRGPVA
jgi:membrane peptidoglycan carboxypeptidase